MSVLTEEKYNEEFKCKLLRHVSCKIIILSISLNTSFGRKSRTSVVFLENNNLIHKKKNYDQGEKYNKYL